MPLEALSAKAMLMVPVGAIDNRWLLRMPYWRMSDLISSGSLDAKRGLARYWSASNFGNAPYSRASPMDARYASWHMVSEIFAAMARPASLS